MVDEKQYLSRIKLNDGTIVDIKDQEAGSELESPFEAIQAFSEGQVTVNKK